MHHKQTDRWTDEQDWFYRIPTTKLVVQSCFFGNSSIKFGSKQYKKKEYNQHSSVFKEIIDEITFVLSKCHRSIDRSIDFHFLLLLWKSSLKQTVKSWKFKILLWIPNKSLLSQTLNSTNFYFSTFPAKINDKFFQINKKPLFHNHFSTKLIFPKS